MSSVPFKSPQLAHGKDFSLSARLFLDQMPQFGDNGLELVDGVRRMPIILLPYTSIGPDGIWTSIYRLNVSHNDLSASGLGNFTFDRNTVQNALIMVEDCQASASAYAGFVISRF